MNDWLKPEDLCYVASFTYMFPDGDLRTILFAMGDNEHGVLTLNTKTREIDPLPTDSIDEAIAICKDYFIDTEGNKLIAITHNK